MSRLGLMGQAFIKMEQGGMSPIYMGGAMILDPSTSPEPLDGTAIAKHLAATMEEIPLMRQKVVQDELRIGNIRLVDDPDFDVNNHVSAVYFEEPAGYDELTEHLGSFSVERLDLNRPLWRFQVIEGLEHGYIAVAMHIHHSILDGVGAMRALGAMWSDKPISARAPRSEAWKARPQPGTLNLIGSAMAENVKRVYVDAPTFLIKNSRPVFQSLSANIGKRLRSQPSGDKATSKSLPPVQQTSLNVPRLSDKRAVAYLEIPLKDIKSLRQKFQCTINDLALFINSWALEHYFREIGETVNFDLICAMPLDTRDKDDASAGVSASLARVNLHNTISGARERLAAIAKDTSDIKQSANRGRRHKTNVQKINYGALGNLFSPLVLEALVYGINRFNLLKKTTLINVAITNVPGNPKSMYIAGAKLVSNVPMAPCADSMGLTITITSTEKLLMIGYHGCGEAIVDKELLVAGARDAVAALQTKRKTKT